MDPNITENDVKAWEERLDREVAWMFSRNWTLNETTYEWSSPTGQTYEYSVGFLTAKEVYLKELGWITLTVVKRRAQWLKHQNKSEEWLYFSHPISKKIYMYLEAEDIAFDHHNDDTSYESSLSTKQINASLHFLLPLEEGDIAEFLFAHEDSCNHLIRLTRAKWALDTL
jgi:hypothetical protein